MSVEKCENQIYVTDLSLITKFYATQMNAHIARAQNLNLIDMTWFVSINDHLEFNK